MIIIKIIKNLLLFAAFIGAGLILFAIEMQYLPNHFSLTDQTQSIIVNVLLNLGTGLISSVIIIGLYDWRIRMKEEREKQNKTNFALQKLITSLKWHFSILFGMYVAAARTKRSFESLDIVLS